MPREIRFLEEVEADPFGPYEYVEARQRCRGGEGECTWNRCSQRESTCRCCCPPCAGDTPEVYGYDGDH